MRTRYNDASSDCREWSTPKLLREARKRANLENFSVGFNKIPATFREGWHGQVDTDSPTVDDFCRKQTRLYRDTWLNPLFDELENRLGARK